MAPHYCGWAMHNVQHAKAPLQLTSLRSFKPICHKPPAADQCPQSHRATRRAALAALAAALSLGLAGRGLAAIPLRYDDSDAQKARAVAQLGAQYVSPRPNRGAAAISSGERIQQGLALLSQARTAAGEGRYAEALLAYSLLLQEYGDFAFTELARVERALVLYQLGRISDALLQLEDEEVALRGNAEVHAALAAVVYAERPAQISRAEQQWEIAMEFDRRYADVEWVQREKHWPPRALVALQRFLALS